MTLAPYDSAVLTADDPLPSRPRRVAVAGVSGVGKTTLAATIATALGSRHVEIDGLFHGPDWVPRPEFVADVEQFTAEPTWVTEWQYAGAREVLAGRADLMVWLDLPRRTVMRRVIGRTLRRRGRKELWNGNVEPPLRTFFTDRDHIVRWAWAQYHRSRAKVLALHQERPELPIVRLARPVEVERWLAALTRPGGAPPARAGR